MNLLRLKEILLNTDADIPDLISFYGRDDLPNTEIIIRSFNKLAKKDKEISDYIKSFHPTVEPLKAKLWLMVHATDIYCPNGNLRTWKDKHGKFFCPLTCPCVSEKKQATNIERYGVPQVLMSKDIKDKANETMLSRYGTTYSLANKTVKAKAIQTNLDRYGVENVFASDEIKEKIKKHNIDTHGVEYFSQSDDFKIKVRETYVDYYSKDTYELLNDKDALTDFVSKNSISVGANILGIDPTTLGKKCKSYGIEITRSTYETEIADFLKQNNISYTKNNRSLISPQEVDFLIPDHKLAIEFNGVYWHSLKENNYHSDKMKKVMATGHRLLMVNEDEWIQRNHAVKLKILNLCHKSEKGVGARKLSVTKITNTSGNAFCDLHHIQGASSGVIASYGAYHDGSLVSVMQFKKQRGTQDIELIRFCSDGKVYAGIFSKLLKVSVLSEGYDKVISFADLRYSDGGVYSQNGFDEVSRIKPDYRYTKKDKTYHKENFTKAQISKKFGIDVENKTERELMLELGYTRIYDCGKIKFIKHFN